MDLSAQLDDLNADEPVRRLVHDLAASTSVLTDRRANYVSVRPAPIGAIAVYAHAHKVSIAVEPLKAQNVQLLGATHQKATRGTTYVILDSLGIEGQYAKVQDLALSALYWRAAGPAMTLGSGHKARQEPEVDICPNCWMPITPAGTCWCQD